MIMIMKVMGNKRTVRRPIASGDHTVYTLLRADLLAKRRDAGVSDESGIERIHAFPRRISCMGAAKKKVLKSQKIPFTCKCHREGEKEGGGSVLGTYGCPKYSTERFCRAREETNPSSSVSPATG